MVWLSDFSPVGSASLERSPNGISFQLATVGLDPGHAYTLWSVVFNDTDECDFGTPGASLCGAEDVVNDDARPDVMWAAGRIVGGSGKATFAGRVAVGDASESINAPVGLPSYGLENPEGAEVHLVVHHHGPKIAEYMPDMITLIDGGCTDAGVPSPGVPSPWNDQAFGQRGPNTCQSVQASIHSPN